MIRFFIVAAGIAVVNPAIVNYMFSQNWISQKPSFLYETTFLVTIFTSSIFVYLYRADKGYYFVRLYLLSMVVKILAYLFYNLFMILEDTGLAVNNILYFLLTYGLFTTAEIAFLFHKITGKSKP